MMPAPPGPHFVVVEPHLTLAFSEARFDRPAQPADPHQLGLRRRGRRITQVVFVDGRVGRRGQGPADDQPTRRSRPAVARLDDPHGDDLGHQRPLAALQDPIPLPARGRDLGGPRIHAHPGRAVRMQPFDGGRPPAPRDAPSSSCSGTPPPARPGLSPSPAPGSGRSDARAVPWHRQSCAPPSPAFACTAACRFPSGGARRPPPCGLPTHGG